MKKTVLNLRKIGFVLVASTAMLAVSCGGGEEAANETVTDAIENATEELNEIVEDANEKIEEMTGDAAATVDSLAEEHACEEGACEEGSCGGGEH